MHDKSALNANRVVRAGRLVVVCLAVGLYVFTLAACNTVEGVGEDVESAGDAISDTAEDVGD